jgi:hypothetical protein
MQERALTGATPGCLRAQGPEPHGEFGPGAQLCAHVGSQFLGLAGPMVAYLGGPPAIVPVEVVIELSLPGGEPVQQRGGELGALPGDGPALAPQRKIGHVFRREHDFVRKRLVPVKIVLAWMPPGVFAHVRSFCHERVGPWQLAAGDGCGMVNA